MHFDNQVSELALADELGFAQLHPLTSGSKENNTATSKIQILGFRRVHKPIGDVTMAMSVIYTVYDQDIMNEKCSMGVEIFQSGPTDQLPIILKKFPVEKISHQ